MEVAQVPDSKPSSPIDAAAAKGGRRVIGMEQLRVKRKTLKSMLEQCQRAYESLSNVDDTGEEEETEIDDDSSSPCSDSETNELCDMLKSKVESPGFLEKLGSLHITVPHNMSEEGSSWDIVSDNDLWEWGNIDGESESDQESYVLVRQDDVVEGIACFMAAYLLSLEQTKDLTPNQLQEALSKTFSGKKKKGKLRKAWDGSKVIYNVASWGATAIGIYQNPALIGAASLAFWNSCHVISKLL